MFPQLPLVIACQGTVASVIDNTVEVIFDEPFLAGENSENRFVPNELRFKHIHMLINFSDFTANSQALRLSSIHRAHLERAQPKPQGANDCQTRLSVVSDP